MLTDATTAEKLEGTSRGVHADPLAFPPPSLPRLPLFRHPCFTHSLPYSSFLLHLNCKLPTVPPRKMAASNKTWMWPNTLGPHDLQCCIEDASHRVTHGGCTHERQSVGHAIKRWRVRSPARARLRRPNYSGQVVHTHVPRRWHSSLLGYIYTYMELINWVPSPSTFI